MALNKPNNWREYADQKVILICEAIESMDTDDVVKYVRWCKRDGEHYATYTETVTKKVLETIEADLDLDSCSYNEKGYIKAAVKLHLDACEDVEKSWKGHSPLWMWISDEKRDLRKRLDDEAQAMFEQAVDSVEEHREALEDLGGRIEVEEDDRKVKVFFGRTTRETCYWCYPRKMEERERVVLTSRTARGRNIEPTPKAENFGRAVVLTETYEQELGELA